MCSCRRRRLALAGLCGLHVACATPAAPAPIATPRPTPPSAASDEWPVYGHDPQGTRFSPATQIDRQNVARLAVAWTFHTGEVSDGRSGRKRSSFESTPILVDGTLYVTTGLNRVIALDPARGTQRWAYDPLIDQTLDYVPGLINRGVATWADSSASEGAPCRRRIFEATLDARLIALDAATGRLCADFGEQGQVSLRHVPRYAAGRYGETSPPAVVGDLVVVGSAIKDDERVDEPSGVVRAFEARTGALRWSWDPLPPNAASSSDGGAPSWRTGAANAWSVMAVDPERELVFVPTGSASPDYYGVQRPGDDRWSDSIVALRARDGTLAWGFQLLHHDLWDYDTASPPLLATLRRAEADVPVVVQGNKSGFLYVFGRQDRAPFFPIEEHAVPASDVPGETAWPTQPIPTKPPPLSPQTLSPDDAWGLTPEDRAACRALVSGLRNEGVFTPPSLRGSLEVPGSLGGENWSGYAFDPARALLIVNTNNLPFEVQLLARTDFDAARRTAPESGQYGDQGGAPYGMHRDWLRSPGAHLPCSKPPWGQLTAIDLNEGTIRWQVPLGGAPGMPSGSVSLGGPIVTAGGLVFVAGTTFSPMLRAFDVETGRQIWQGSLPADGNATPMTYRLADGKQYVVIAAGGHSMNTAPQSDALVAFALP